MTDHDALRAALAEALSQVDYDAGHERAPAAWYGQRSDAILAHPAILAALAGSDQAAGLDVERLYHAMRIVDDVAPGAFDIIAVSDPDARRVAEHLASVYADLAATPTASPTAPTPQGRKAQEKAAERREAGRALMVRNHAAGRHAGMNVDGCPSCSAASPTATEERE